MNTHSIYIHIPFCRHRCGYCDFNTYAGLESLIPAYVNALCAEISYLKSQLSEPIAVHTIFFGGGTPSLLEASQLRTILKTLQNDFDILPDAEISMEANPGTLDAAYLGEIREVGLNRLSIGMQSANPFELRLLERQHEYPQVIQAITWARQAGFNNINLDLIYGLPEQWLEHWQRSLKLAAGLQPEHLALYALTLEHGTPFGAWARRGLLSTPDPDLAAEMYEWASDLLELKSYTQYEISNWALDQGVDGAGINHPYENPRFACQHNLQYWRNLPYLGVGAGAHGYAAGIRTANVLAPQAYINRLSNERLEPKALAKPFPYTPATQSAQQIDQDTEIGETMMMGLRLVREGVSSHRFQLRFGRKLTAEFDTQIQYLTKASLIEWTGEQGEILRLSKKGRLLGNQVFVEFI
jgi:oxygen-independent coproporphyrinogen-3 oxidase